MNARALMSVAAMVVAAVAANAEPKHALQYTAVSCIRAGELPLLQVKVDGAGDLRAYFRRINTTDWCSVDGINEGPLSRVVLPKFEPGDEIEYFFVLLEGRRVAARSPRIYRASVNQDCEVPWARHVARFSMSCGGDAAGLPSSMGAGYAIGDAIVLGNPPLGSPDRPETTSRPRP